MHIKGLVQCLAYAKCSVSCDVDSDGVDVSGTWKMSRAGISREEREWPSRWIMRKEGEQTCWKGVPRRYNFLILLPKVTKHLLAELIKERRKWMLQRQSAALKLSLALKHARCTLCLMLGPRFMDRTHFSSSSLSSGLMPDERSWKALDILRVRATCGTYQSRPSCFPDLSKCEPFPRHRGNVVLSRLRLADKGKSLETVFSRL